MQAHPLAIESFHQRRHVAINCAVIANYWEKKRTITQPKTKGGNPLHPLNENKTKTKWRRRPRIGPISDQQLTSARSLERHCATCHPPTPTATPTLFLSPFGAADQSAAPECGRRLIREVLAFFLFFSFRFNGAKRGRPRHNGRTKKQNSIEIKK